MKIKVLFPVVLIAFVLLLQPATALAGLSVGGPYNPFEVNSYISLNDGTGYLWDDDNDFGPSAPVYANVWMENPPMEVTSPPVGPQFPPAAPMQYAGAASKIEDFQDYYKMYVNADAENFVPGVGTQASGQASAAMMWRGIATDNMLNITYDYFYDLAVQVDDAAGQASNEVYASLYVYDLTADGFLYSDGNYDAFRFMVESVNVLWEVNSDSASGAGSGSIYVPLTVGNEIEYRLMIGEYAGINDSSGSAGAQGGSLDFNVDVAIVPEPVSSTLFLVGAAALGYRRFRKG